MSTWPPRRRRDWFRAHWRWLVGGTVALYVGSYLCFTVWGQYTARVDGGPPTPPVYRWVPGEFFDYRQKATNHALELLFAPLLALDRAVWHTEEKAERGSYPVLLEESNSAR